jgi:Thioredoxin like C-terminal domain
LSVLVSSPCCRSFFLRLINHFGEGKSAESEAVIQRLLREKNSMLNAAGLVRVQASGSQATPDLGNVSSSETYVGYARQKNFASPQQIQKNGSQSYTVPSPLTTNAWGLVGT